MSGFDPGWLDLREPADARARSGTLAASLTAAFARLSPSERLDITDLGGGTGANLRCLAPLLGPRQHWRIVDNDSALLAAQLPRLKSWAAMRGWTFAAASGTKGNGGPGGVIITSESCELTIEPAALDLSAGLDALALPPSSLVTASALLDLVSASWLERSAGLIAAARSTAFFALTYDGRIRLEPALAEDDELRELVNMHQRRDKGFGAALGPAANAATAAAFERHGYRVSTARSDWRLAADDGALQRALIGGWLTAALEVDSAARQWSSGWASIRSGQIERGELEIVVGHGDLLALPP